VRIWLAGGAKGRGRDMLNIAVTLRYVDCLCGLVVGVSGYRYRGLGFDPRRYQIF